MISDRPRRLGDATRTINVIRQAVGQEISSGARVEYSLGQVASTSGYSADVYVNGNYEEASEDFRIPAGAYIQPGDYVSVGVDHGGNLGKWIQEVMPESLYAKIVLDPIRGKIYTGDGSTPPSTEFTGGGGSHPDLAAHDTLGLATQTELDAHVAQLLAASTKGHAEQLANGANDGTAAHTAYPNGISMMLVTSSGAAGWPTSGTDARGLVMTFKGEGSSSYGAQLWMQRGEVANRMFFRTWDQVTTSWEPWIELGTAGGSLTDHTHATSGSGATGGGASLAPTQLDLPSSASPAQVEDGRIVWHSSSDIITVGRNGTTRREFGYLGTTVASAQAFGDAQAAGTGLETSRVDHKHGMPANPVTAHEAAGDPHTGYQLESEKGAANGYASLDSGILVPVAQLGSGTADNTKFLRGDRTWAVPSGGGGSTIPVLAIDAGASTQLNNWNPTGLSGQTGPMCVLRIVHANSLLITGIVPPTAALNANQTIKLIIVNTLNVALTLGHQHASSSAANRFFFSGGTTVTVPTRGAVQLWYDTEGSQNEWRRIEG